jgi:hypothetical protein
MKESPTTQLGMCQCEHMDHFARETHHNGVEMVAPSRKHPYQSVLATHAVQTTFGHFNVCSACAVGCPGYNGEDLT